MKKKYVSPILLVLFQLFLVLRGTYYVVVQEADWALLTNLVVSMVIILAVYRPSAVWARKFGVFFGLLQVTLGAILVAYGMWRFITVNYDSLLYVYLGLFGVGLGSWTVSVLRTAAREYRSIAA